MGVEQIESKHDIVLGEPDLKHNMLKLLKPGRILFEPIDGATMKHSQEDKEDKKGYAKAVCTS